MVLQQHGSICKIKLNPSAILYTRIKTLTRDLTAKYKTTKVQEGTMGKFYHNLGIGKAFYQFLTHKRSHKRESYFKNEKPL